MSAYVIADIDVEDPEAYEEYRRGVPASVAQFGGRFLVRGGNPQPLEGGWTPSRIVVLEFPNAERAREWYASPAYAELRKLRQSASSGSLILVEGAA